VTGTNVIVLNLNDIITRFCVAGSGFNSASTVAILNSPYDWGTETVNFAGDATLGYLVVEAYRIPSDPGLSLESTGDLTITVTTTDPATSSVSVSVPFHASAFYDDSASV
jgi:hypothetical protein